MVDLTGFGSSPSLVLRENTSSSLKTKSKIFNLLTICVAASAVLAPTQGAFAATAGQPNSEEAQHWICVKQGQQLICNIEAKTAQELAASPSIKPDAKSTSLNSSKTSVFPQLLTSTEQDFLANNFLWLSYLLPGGLAVALFIYDKYSGYRESVLKAQINYLEKLWQHRTEP